MAKKARTIEKDRGYQKLMGQIDILEGAPYVAVGFFSGDDPAGGGGEDGGGLSVASYMFLNEVGIPPHVPDRPVMAQTAEAEQSSMEKAIRSGSIRILSGKDTVKGVLTRMGILYTGKLKEAITAFDDPPNKKATIEQKGFDNPLIDSGTARNAVTWEVHERGG